MVDIATIPSLIRKLKWGFGEADEHAKHLREPLLLNDRADYRDSDCEANTSAVYKSDHHVVVQVEPKLGFQRLVRIGRASTLGVVGGRFMNNNQKAQTSQEIIISALIKLAIMTMCCVSLLVGTLYSQAS
jgi:hypothetical protein